MNSFKKGELEIMELLWGQERALTHAEISNRLKETTGRNTVYLHLNSLLAKGAIQIGPSVRRGRTYGRTFLAAVSKAEYLASQVVDVAQGDSKTLQTMFAYFLGAGDVTNETLDELEKRIQEKRKELNS